MLNSLTAKDELSRREKFIFLWSWTSRRVPRGAATHANTLPYNGLKFNNRENSDTFKANITMLVNELKKVTLNKKQGNHPTREIVPKMSRTFYRTQGITYLFWRSKILWHSSLYFSWCSATVKREPRANLFIAKKTKDNKKVILCKARLFLFFV